MGIAEVAARERAGLATVMAEAGPDAPTLCGSWTTRDLAAHLYLREHTLRSIPGLVLGGRAGAYTERLREGTLAGHDYPDVVEAFRTGPPVWPLGLPGARRFIHLHELFPHHEDVRRANGMARRHDPELDAAVWQLLGRARRILGSRRRLGSLGLAVECPGFGSIALRSGDPAVTLEGPPTEVFLYLIGRGEVAEAEPSGTPEALALLAQANLAV